MGNQSYHNYSKLLLLVWQIHIHSLCFCILCSFCFFSETMCFKGFEIQVTILSTIILVIYFVLVRPSHTNSLAYSCSFFFLCSILLMFVSTLPFLFTALMHKEDWSLCFQWRISQLWVYVSCCHNLTKSEWTYCQWNSLHKNLLIEHVWFLTVILDFGCDRRGWSRDLISTSHCSYSWLKRVLFSVFEAS